jgi:hypothetical protein
MRTALAFHAEQLHRPEVWSRVETIALRVSRLGSAATFFAYPYRAERQGADISERLRFLAGWGHEIGQHTHFYAPGGIDPDSKQDDLSEANVERCLERDFAAIERAGIRPRGFSAGGWKFNDAVQAALIRLGFAYDCSLRGRVPAVRNEPLLRIPTTHSFRELLLLRGAVSYRVAYLHDYDLLDDRKYLLLRAFLLPDRRRLSRVDAFAEELR